jgi:hypothetical protein
MIRVVSVAQTDSSPDGAENTGASLDWSTWGPVAVGAVPTLSAVLQCYILAAGDKQVLATLTSSSSLGAIWLGSALSAIGLLITFAPLVYVTYLGSRIGRSGRSVRNERGGGLRSSRSPWPGFRSFSPGTAPTVSGTGRYWPVLWPA